MTFDEWFEQLEPRPHTDYAVLMGRQHREGIARAAWEKQQTEIDALARFKAYVHQRLDAAGIPTHPDGPHSKEGCRVGDRLDIALASLPPPPTEVTP